MDHVLKACGKQGHRGNAQTRMYASVVEESISLQTEHQRTTQDASTVICLVTEQRTVKLKIMLGMKEGIDQHTKEDVMDSEELKVEAKMKEEVQGSPNWR